MFVEGLKPSKNDPGHCLIYLTGSFSVEKVKMPCVDVAKELMK